mmetsp:Transcript_20347/g.42571  ORF Transcript_20347/g.42571 Transcript_20347/m.42571 type:complete len:186 (+) Transcript_20347:252-809(+)
MLSLTPEHPKKKRCQQSNRSPFLVDLVAENERIDEENKVRFREITRKQKALERRREAAKNDIILRALQEGNELENLRMEKRKILDEEKRLKALIEIEKTNAHRKDDRQAAVLAEKRRHAAKVEKRRVENMEKLAEREAVRMKKLEIKHNLKPKKKSCSKGSNGDIDDHQKSTPNSSISSLASTIK